MLIPALSGKLGSIGLMLLFHFFLRAGISNTICSAVQHNKSAAESALAPTHYTDFLKHDFGWDERVMVIGFLNGKRSDFYTRNCTSFL